MSKLVTISGDLTVAESGRRIMNPPISITGSYDEDVRARYSIPDGDSATVNLGTMAAIKILFLSSDQEIGVNVNGVGSLPMVGDVILQSTTGFTSVVLSNSSGSIASVELIAFGA